MSQLDELYEYKNKLMKDLCTDINIVRLVTGDPLATPVNPLLAYTQIFPYERIPETVDEAKAFICFDIDIDKVQSKTFYSPVLYIWAFCHKSMMRMPEGGVRTDKLSVAINDILNGNRDYGLGELALHSVGRFSPADDYQGRTLVYSASDFNRPGVSKAPPSARR